MKDPLAVPRILWIALLMSTLLIAAVAFFLPVPPLSAPPPAVMPVIFGALAVSLAVVSFVLPKQILGQALRGMDDLVTEEPDPEAPAFFREASPKRRVVHLDDRKLAAVMPRWQTPFILSLALSESISLFGFVLSRLGFDLRIAAGFLVAGSLLVLARVPTKPGLVASVERAVGAPVLDETGRG